MRPPPLLRPGAAERGCSTKAHCASPAKTELGAARNAEKRESHPQNGEPPGFARRLPCIGGRVGGLRVRPPRQNKTDQSLSSFPGAWKPKERGAPSIPR